MIGIPTSREVGLVKGFAAYSSNVHRPDQSIARSRAGPGSRSSCSNERLSHTWHRLVLACLSAKWGLLYWRSQKWLTTCLHHAPWGGYAPFLGLAPPCFGGRMRRHRESHSEKIFAVLGWSRFLPWNWLLSTLQAPENNGTKIAFSAPLYAWKVPATKQPPGPDSNGDLATRHTPEPMEIQN